MTTETIKDTTAKPERQVRDDVCPRCGSDDLDGDFVSSGGDSAIQEMFCPNCSETWENHYSFDRMDFPVTDKIVYVETETERQRRSEIENLKSELLGIAQAQERKIQALERIARAGMVLCDHNPPTAVEPIQVTILDMVTLYSALMDYRPPSEWTSLDLHNEWCCRRYDKFLPGITRIRP